jgi:hypothetical protein
LGCNAESIFMRRGEPQKPASIIVSIDPATF